jgi:hypothetical protein
MPTNDTKDWSELFDVALFGANRINLAQRMERATNAIHRRMEELLEDENAGSISEHVALRNALTTLADLQKMASARKPNGAINRGSGQAITG